MKIKIIGEIFKSDSVNKPITILKKEHRVLGKSTRKRIEKTLTTIKIYTNALFLRDK